MTVSPQVLERKYSEFDLDMGKWSEKKPHGISALVRLKNDTEFVEWTILSHMEWIDEFILEVQPSDDDTEKLAESLAKRYAKVKVIHYPFDVEWLTPRVSELNESSIESPAYMTNWGLTHCNYSWIAKIEGDVIALPTFAMIRDLVDINPNDEKYYGRVGLNVAGKEFSQISKTFPRNAGWDESVFPNNPKFHCVTMGMWETINMNDYTNLMDNKGWSFMHMKRCKEGKAPGVNEAWTDFTRKNVEEALVAYDDVSNSSYPGPEYVTTEVLYDWRDSYSAIKIQTNA